MSSAALALEGVAGKFAAEAIRQDSQGDRNSAITSYQRAIDALVKLIQLFPDNTLNAVYEQHCKQYKKRISRTTTFIRQLSLKMTTITPRHQCTPTSNQTI